MKRILTSLMLAAIAIPAYCQITLTQSNYPLPTDTVALLDVTSQVTANPTLGNNQTWNYSSINTSGISPAYNIYIPVSGDANFPAAQVYMHNLTKGLTSSLGYYFDQYYDITSDGAQAIGIHVPAQAYGLGALTGNATDTLYILDNVIYYPSTPRPVVEFPATAGSSWHSSVYHVVNMQLTVAAASLNKAPMQQTFYINRNDSIVGWGLLDLPVVTGFNNNIPVLQCQTTQYSLDSFYVGGSPAPTSLTGPFGITQGQTSNPIYNRIEMYREGSFNYQMLFNYTDNTFSTLYGTGGAYVNTALPIATGINEIATDGFSSIYPNPMNGKSFDISLTTDAQVSAVSIQDISGKVIDNIPAVNNGGMVHVQTTSILSDGLYIYSVTSINGNLITKGKIVSVK